MIICIFGKKNVISWKKKISERSYHSYLSTSDFTRNKYFQINIEIPLVFQSYLSLSLSSFWSWYTHSSLVVVNSRYWWDPRADRHVKKTTPAFQRLYHNHVIKRNMVWKLMLTRINLLARQDHHWFCLKEVSYVEVCIDEQIDKHLRWNSF